MVQQEIWHSLAQSAAPPTNTCRQHCVPCEVYRTAHKGYCCLMHGALWLTLIFRNRLGMFSSSKGKDPHSRAYRMTPQLHTSTSGPQYSFPEMTCNHK